MATCRFKVFQSVLEPWLDTAYVRKVLLHGNGELQLFFTDGGCQDYRIDDCRQEQLAEILDSMQQKGILVEMADTGEAVCVT